MEKKGEHKAAKADLEYKKQLESTNSFMNSCYTEKFPQIFKELQQLESSAIQLEKDQLRKLVSFFESMSSSVGTSLQNLGKQIDYMNNNSQLQFSDVFQVPKKLSYDSLEELEVMKNIKTPHRCRKVS